MVVHKIGISAAPSTVWITFDKKLAARGHRRSGPALHSRYIEIRIGFTHAHMRARRGPIYPHLRRPFLMRPTDPGTGFPVTLPLPRMPAAGQQPSTKAHEYTLSRSKRHAIKRQAIRAGV